VTAAGNRPATTNRPAAGDKTPAGPGVAWVDLLLVLVIGLLVQAGWAALVREPTYMDAYYYASNGQRLAGGHGFSERIIWQFLDILFADRGDVREGP